MATHFESNIRLRWVFRVCKNLGIDDPCHWMNSVSPSVVDQWIAFEIQESKTMDSKKPMSPEEAMASLGSIGGTSVGTN